MARRTPAEFIAVVSRQRSSSTALSMAIAHHPCVAWGNEIFHPSGNARLRRACGTQDRFAARLLRAHGKGAVHAARFSHPMAYLRAVRDLQLSARWPKRGGAGCTRSSYALVFKLFDRHVHGRLEEGGLRDLLANPRVAVVVLERDAGSAECSLEWARRAADWGMRPDRHSRDYAAFRAAHCAGRMPTPSYRSAHDAWYGRVRTLLRSAGKPFLEVSFNESTHELTHVLRRVYTLARLWTDQWSPQRDVTEADVARFQDPVYNETCAPPPNRIFAGR